MSREALEQFPLPVAIGLWVAIVVVIGIGRAIFDYRKSVGGNPSASPVSKLLSLLLLLIPFLIGARFAFHFFEKDEMLFAMLSVPVVLAVMLGLAVPIRKLATRYLGPLFVPDMSERDKALDGEER